MMMRAEKTRYATLGGLAGCLAGLVVALLPGHAATAEYDIRRDATVDVIEKVNPSVVNIAAVQMEENSGDQVYEALKRYFGWRRQEPFSIGSGVIVDEDGYILTNNHVVERASTVQVKLWDGRVYEAEVFASTVQKDVAVLRLKTKPGEKFKPIKFAKDDDLLLGETVLALGNPYGLGGSVTKGILSSKNRRVTSGDEPLSAQDWLQTDADINPGNSGGPLVNMNGELIGMNVAQYRADEGKGVGFAIPIRQLASVLPELFTPEASKGYWFGGRLASSFNQPFEIASVMPGSPADKAGLKEKDRILTVNGTTPKRLADFNNLVVVSSNRLVALEVERGGARRVVRVQMVSFGEITQQKAGLTLLNLTREVAATYGLRDERKGLFIEDVQKGSPAESAQLKRGMVLMGIDGQSTSDVLSAVRSLSAKKAGEATQLSLIAWRPLGGSFVQRGPATATIEVR